MKLSALESELKAEVKGALGLSEEQLKNFSVAPPPPHIRADLSLAWPVSAAGSLKQPPLKIAGEVREALAGKFSAEVLPPGFVNIRLADRVLLEIAAGMVSDPGHFLNPANSEENVNIEFVSANPTGPLHLASGRGATLGDSLARIMRFLGYKVSREFYVNNVGKQVELLGQSLKARFLGAEPPDGGYKGGYLKDIAARLPQEASGWSDEKFSSFAAAEILALHKADMKAFGVEFDRWFLESELHEAGAPEKARETLKARGIAYEKDGALWFGGSAETDSDDKDRVLVKSDGGNTYFLNDIAYHLDKYDRGFTRVIDVWGADHHGYIPRMEAAVSALGKDKASFKAVLHQMVLLKRGGTLAKMSKREGDFVPLSELVSDAGADACRFFFAMRGPNTHLTFDVDLARKKSNDNPVYYVQYVHARITSIFNNAFDKGIDPAGTFDAAGIVPNGEERLLLLKLMWFERILETCVRDYSPHHLSAYLTELSALFHSFYDKHKVLDPGDPRRSAFRLFLLKGVKFAVAEGLGLLGVSAPEKM